jgi:SpoVK/Ycf46/Vps4 family AAA+-type ATPase
MLHAAQPVGDTASSSTRRQRTGRNIPGWFGNLGSAVDDEIESGLEEFFEPLREMMKEFEKMQQVEGSHSEDEGISAWPPFHHLPQAKRFDYPDIDDTHDSRGPKSPTSVSSADKAIEAAMKKLRDMGCQVFLPHSTATATDKEGEKKDDKLPPKTTVVNWGPLAGYNEQKRAIEDCLLLPLVRPEVYDTVARGTREKFAPNRPRAVLFVGPPGTGKTSSARVIASQAAVPLIYIPLESLGSKWYGESEKKLAEALAAADSLPEGCIIFLDELDALATSRSGDMHEATRRLLGVLLRHMDGFDTSKRSVVVGATNRAQDLDNALLSRFSAVVEFGLPDEMCRRDILKTYAKNLKDAELMAVASATPGMAGRDLRDICEQAERKWAAKIIRGQAAEGSCPPVKEYLDAANARLVEMTHARGAEG